MKAETAANAIGIRTGRARERTTTTRDAVTSFAASENALVNEAERPKVMERTSTRGGGWPCPTA